MISMPILLYGTVYATHTQDACLWCGVLHPQFLFSSSLLSLASLSLLQVLEASRFRHQVRSQRRFLSLRGVWCKKQQTSTTDNNSIVVLVQQRSTRSTGIITAFVPRRVHLNLLCLTTGGVRTECMKPTSYHEEWSGCLKHYDTITLLLLRVLLLCCRGLRSTARNERRQCFGLRQ